MIMFNQDAPKQSANLSINRDLLRRVKKMKINLSQTLEKRLLEILQAESRSTWRKGNRKAIKAYNERIEESGVFSNGLRRF